MRDPHAPWEASPTVADYWWLTEAALDEKKQTNKQKNTRSPCPVIVVQMPTWLKFSDRLLLAGNQIETHLCFSPLPASSRGREHFIFSKVSRELSGFDSNFPIFDSTFFWAAFDEDKRKKKVEMKAKRACQLIQNRECVKEADLICRKLFRQGKREARQRCSRPHKCFHLPPMFWWIIHISVLLGRLKPHKKAHLRPNAK